MTAVPSERARFAAHGWDLDSIEAACAELDRLSGMARSIEVEAIALRSALDGLRTPTAAFTAVSLSSPGGAR